MPQTDGRTRWAPRGEIYLQIIQQKREEGGGAREWRQREERAGPSDSKDSEREGDKERSKD